MISFVLQRLLTIVPVALGVATFTFFILFLTPGDPATVVAGPDAPAAVVDEIRAELGLDQPVYVQYVRYIAQLVQLDLGASILTKRSVASEIARYLPNTFELLILTMFLTVVVGIPLGILAALRRGTWLDSAAMAVALVGLTMPVFSIGLALIWAFGFQLMWFPIGGRGGPLWTADGLMHAVLPSVTLASYSIGSLARITRSAMLEVLGEDFVRTARAKGVGQRSIVYKHALRNAALPLVTILGLQFGFLLGGAVVTETVFSWPGMGRMMIQAILRKDFPLVQGSVLIFALSFVVINLIVDVIYVLINPRVRVG
jgi:ABC-type dipeptide/oligopeptide/nickel transport system permease component